jgi:hypothetical protein
MKNLDISEKLAAGTRHITIDKPNPEASDPIDHHHSVVFRRFLIQFPFWNV